MNDSRRLRVVKTLIRGGGGMIIKSLVFVLNRRLSGIGGLGVVLVVSGGSGFVMES